MRIVFMGTPDFAVGALEAIIQAGHEVAAVVTQPDKPKGRNKEMQAPPVKICALEHNLAIFQPEKIKTPEAIEVLRQYNADMFVVAAFGQILSSEILNMPQYGCINIHASLLPKYRGAAPINWVIINGEQETGVTIMKMDEGIDTGDMLLNEHIEIAKDETAETLFTKLSECGARLIVRAIPLIEQHKLLPVPQNHAEASKARILKKEMGCIDFNAEAIQIERMVRGMNPWPCAYTYYHKKVLKIWTAEVAMLSADTTVKANGPAGTVASIEKEAICVNTGHGVIKFLEIQLEGKKRITAREFLLGNQFTIGEKLGLTE